MDPNPFISNRREVRVLVLQALCEYDSVGHDAIVVLERILDDRKIVGDSRGFARDIVEKVLENFSSVDNIIGKLASDWPLTRIAVVDRNVLRTAISELRWCTERVPEKAVLNEAVELANYFNSIKFGEFQDWRLPTEDEIKSLYHEKASNQDKYGKEIHLWPAFPSGGLATVWLKGESGHEGTLFDFKNGEFRPLYKSKSGRMTVRLVRGEMLS